MNTLLSQDAATPHQDSIRYIPLTQGQFAIVDAVDFDWLNQWKWYANYASNTGSFYASRREKAQSLPYRQVGVPMHRFILGATKGLLVDHRDGDTLNNRRSNLRLATQQQNAFNRKGKWNSSSRYKGVSWHAKTEKWRAVIRVNKKLISLGLFRSELEASESYKMAAEFYFGEFAYHNRPVILPVK